MFDKRFREMLMMDYATKNQNTGVLGDTNNVSSGLLENTGGFFGNLGNINPNILLGANIVGQGIQGKDPFSSFLPAVQETGKIQSNFMQMEEMKRKMEENKKARALAEKQREFFDTLPEDSFYKKIAEAFPKVAVNAIINERLYNIEQSDKNEKDKKQDVKDLFKYITDQENNLFSSYQSNKVVQDFDQSTQSITKLFAGLDANDGAGDVAAIFTFMKTLDPQSVVREGEFATAENSTGVFKKYWNAYNRLVKGERLTEEQREAFKEVGINLYQQNQKAVDNVRYNFTQIANNQGLNIDNIFVDSDIRPKFENVQTTTAPGQESEFKTQRVPPGAILVDYQDGKYFFQVPGRKEYLVTDGFK
tara:strand:- start:2993 stop:4078 length:1086 start_codon:yes stop_codon:yes gene_type:complete